MPEVIPHWLTKQADIAPDQIAIEHINGKTITFSKLKTNSQQFAKKLANYGVGKGTHVGVLSTNNASMVIAIHALSYIGAVSVLLNTRLTKEELTYQINDAEMMVVLTCDSLEKEVMVMDLPVPVKTFSEISHLPEMETDLQTEIILDDVFTIIYTSGTTGFPKGVIHTYGNHWWSAMGSALNIGLDSNDKWLAALPIFHVSGLSIFIKSVIYGMPVYLMEKFDQQVVQDAIMERGVTMVSVVTVMLKRLVDLLGNNTYPDTFRCMLLGGGPAPRPLLEKAKAKHIPVFQSYGMTETSSQIVTLSPLNALNKIGSAGKPLFPAQLKIDHTKEDSVGEIFVKGPMVTRGYFNKKEATNSAFQNGWLATGDLGYLDHEGFLYVVDRRKDLIISGGENIYPSEVESVLSGIEQVSEVGVVGKADETWGQVPVAFVVAIDQTISESDVIKYSNNYLAKYKVPKQVFFVDKLPRNASNKLVRGELAKWIQNN
ncbi:o-succinylbenzoate--CoA ligase [Virgibacillus oceani]|uniref:2-succinylbenzoate--CoA ligase n=1 Tax=Virgibacillus oceani TaxID=1479511 RepID=A0A917LYU1_9BACI|nr:o-succinylbenzoate--CoA ligase [Virgibacillus oceani]GGG66136.1 2-succinylbenzoate--CoA ligase [Virgibacillus oceani]